MCVWFGKGTSGPNVTLLCYNTAFVVFFFLFSCKLHTVHTRQERKFEIDVVGDALDARSRGIGFLFNGGMTQRVYYVTMYLFSCMI